MTKTLEELMALADDYAREVADTPHMPTPLERRVATVRIEDQRTNLESALRELIADAQRYRWLRNFATEDEWSRFWEKDPPELMDAAIDAARQSASI